MSSASQRLAELGRELPPVATPVAAYVPATRSGGWVLTSGQLPSIDGQLIAEGLVGEKVSPERAAECAERAMLNALAAAASLTGGLDGIARIVKVTVFVASAPGFTGQPQVANGASNLLGAVFGDAGAHVRSAVGVTTLPLNAPVEVELTVEPIDA